MIFELCLFCRPQNIELGATGGTSKHDSSKMEEMTVEQMTARANQVTDEVLSGSHTQNLRISLSFVFGFRLSKTFKLVSNNLLSIKCPSYESCNRSCSECLKHIEHTDGLLLSVASIICLNNSLVVE